MATKTQRQRDQESALTGALSGLTKPTEAARPQVEEELPKAGPLKSTGVAINAAEMAAIEAIVERTGLPRNAVLRVAIRRVIADDKAGRVDWEQFIERPRVPRNKLRL